MEPTNKFVELAAINVSKHIEKKNGMSYLSWAYAVDTLLRADPSATWSFGDPVRWGETVMVFCTVNAFGKSMTCQLPVIDHRNKAILNPDAFQVNVSMQRCLAKAIALHGIGLYIYAGEDLPIDTESSKSTVETPANSPVAGIQPQQLAELAALSLAADMNEMINKALKKTNLDSIEKLNTEQAAKLIKWLNDSHKK